MHCDKIAIVMIEKLGEINEIEPSDPLVCTKLGFYDYNISNGSLFASNNRNKNIKLEIKEQEYNLENGSSEEEWHQNEFDFSSYDFKSNNPLLCLYNAIKVVESWKKDLKTMFPDNGFCFLINYQNDQDAITATFRFEVFRKKQGFINYAYESIVDESDTELVGTFIEFID